MCEAGHACMRTDKDAVRLRLWASLPRACRTRAVLTGDSRQTRKGCLVLCERLCANLGRWGYCVLLQSSKQPTEDLPSEGAEEALPLAERDTYLLPKQLPHSLPCPWSLLLPNRTGEGSSINSVQSSKSLKMKANKETSTENQGRSTKERPSEGWLTAGTCSACSQPPGQNTKGNVSWAHT